MSPTGQDATAELSGRRFSFYPAIRNIEHNEWTLVESTWSEWNVENASSGARVWIPRNAIGEVSTSDEPLLIVGLRRELQYKAGTVTPYQTKVLAMPARREPPPTPSDRESNPPPRATGTQETQDRRVGRMIGWALAFGGAFTLLLIVVAAGDGRMPLASWFQQDTSTADQRYIGMDNEADLEAVVRRLGAPEEDRWITSADAPMQFRLIGYPSRRYGVILMGGGRDGLTYAGTIHLPTRELLDSVPLSGGRSTSALLRNLPDF